MTDQSAPSTTRVFPGASDILEASVYVEDLDAAERFYGQTLGFRTIARVGNRHVFFRFRNSVLLVFNPAETRQPPGNPELPVPAHGSSGEGHVCFVASASDLDRWREHFEAQAIPVEADFLWPNGCRSIYIRDPSGNSVEFSERGLWFRETDANSLGERQP